MDKKTEEKVRLNGITYQFEVFMFFAAMLCIQVTVLLYVKPTLWNRQEWSLEIPWGQQKTGECNVVYGASTTVKVRVWEMKDMASDWSGYILQT